MRRTTHIYKTPEYLIIHFKRFDGDEDFAGLPGLEMDAEKSNDFINFPMEGLDISKYVYSDPSEEASRSNRHLYDLYGVVHHSGTLLGGHYWATCKNFREGEWYCLNDSGVSKAREREIIDDTAYVLFYKKSS